MAVLSWYVSSIVLVKIHQLTYIPGGVICLLNCDNERDLNLLNSPVNLG